MRIQRRAYSITELQSMVAELKEQLRLFKQIDPSSLESVNCCQLLLAWMIDPAAMLATRSISIYKICFFLQMLHQSSRLMSY